MDYFKGILYFFITAGLFGLYFVLISILGAIVLFWIKRKNNENSDLSKLEFILISFAIGLGIYIPLSYILDILQFFNFFTAYLSIIIIDGIFLLYLWKSNLLQVGLKKLSEKIIENKKYFIGILIIFSFSVFLLFFRFWNKVVNSSALHAIDSYSWTGSVFYLIEKGHINYNWFGNEYPCGFTFINSGILLIYPDNTAIYFFMKFAFLPYMIIYLLCLLALAIRIFKEKIHLIAITMVLMLSFNYFLTRAFMFLPSLLSSILILIAILILGTKIPNFILGFIVPTLYFVHIISGMFCFIILIPIYIFKIIKNIKLKKELFTIVKEIIIILVIALILIIPYLIHAHIYWGQTIQGLFSYFLNIVIMVNNNSGSLVIPDINFYLLLFEISFDCVNSIGYDKLDELLFKRTVGLFLFFAIIPLFLKSNNEEKEIKDILYFLKLSFAIMIAIFIVPDLLQLDFITRTHFYTYFSYRSFESYAGPVILLIGLGINWAIMQLNKLWQRIKENSRKIKNFIEAHQLRRVKVNFEIILIVFFILSSVLFTITRRNYYYKYVTPDYFAENIIYLLDNAPSGSDIYIPDFDTDDDPNTHNKYYRLLYNFDYIRYNFSYKPTFTEFYNFCRDNEIDYILLKRSRYNSTFIDDLDDNNDFELLYHPRNDDSLYGVYEFDE